MNNKQNVEFWMTSIFNTQSQYVSLYPFNIIQYIELIFKLILLRAKLAPFTEIQLVNPNTKYKVKSVLNYKYFN